MIHKHEIPILEFDDNPQAVIMPTHEDLDLNLPARCVYAFLEEEIERYANAVGAEKVGEFVSATKSYPIFVMSYNGEEICLAQAPVGSARETPDKVSYRIEEGCSVVEMECSALAAVAQLRGAIWGLLLFTADSLADIDNYDQRDWGSEAFDKALELCLDIIVQM